jgi:hypothetical protein
MQPAPGVRCAWLPQANQTDLTPPPHNAGGCEYHTNCAACVADTTCGWCGNDPYHAGGFGFTAQGDHTEGNPFSEDAYMIGGIGKVILDSAQGETVTGRNTVFTKQFRGKSSINVDGGLYDGSSPPEVTSSPNVDMDSALEMGTNPFRLKVTVNGTECEFEIREVTSDTEMSLIAPASSQCSFHSDYVAFAPGLPRGKGALRYGNQAHEVVLPGSESVEQLTVLCEYQGSAANDLPTTPPITTDRAAGCKFTKELKVGYLLVLDKLSPPTVRTITSIKSDTELTVDHDPAAGIDAADGAYAAVDGYGPGGTKLPHSETTLADEFEWTWVACPPRVGKNAIGLGVIETHYNQEDAFEGTTAIAVNDGNIETCSGACTLKRHRIIGRGSRFESQFGPSSSWANNGTGAYFGLGPWMTVEINGDLETQRVSELGTTGSYAEYFLLLENSFSEPLLMHTHFNWYTMLVQGYGKLRSYGRRVVSEAWSNREFSSMYGEGRTQGYYGNTRFLTQLRTGYFVTACGQTRQINSIQSDVEMTIDRPFTLGNREFIPASASSPAEASDLHVRGLTRLLPLWPRGVTIEIIVTKGDSAPKFKYHVWWKTFKHTDDGDANAADDACTAADIDADVDCGILMESDSWRQLEDKELQKQFGVYLKWDATAVATGSHFTKYDSWRLHVADIENCEYYISTEGERFETDDNMNPPVCYNHGKCQSITSDATTIAEASNRPKLTAPGLVEWDATTMLLTSAPDPEDSNRDAKFTSDVSPGDIIRLLDPLGGDDDYDIRVVRVVSDTSLVSDSRLASLVTTARNYQILKCAAGRRGGVGHSDSIGDNTAAAGVPYEDIVPDEHPLAYLPHPEHTFYQTWSYKYCEVDPGCCGFRVSSIVQPQQFAYYFVKPDHSNYNFRIAVHTVNDNIDLYTRRDDDGSGRPDTTNYHLTSVRESVPWAIDEDEYDFACLTDTLETSVLAGGTSYDSTLGHYSQENDLPNCEKWVAGVMGDNRYPQTVGSSEYTARFYLEFNFPDFECEDSSKGAKDINGFSQASHKSMCVQNNLRFVRDADVVLNSADAPQWVVRLTETRKRENNAFVRWREAGGVSYPDAQRSGAVWWHRKLHLWDGFETNFVFQITDPSQCGGEDKICDGADGFAFVITNDDRQEDGEFDCPGADYDNGVHGTCAFDGYDDALIGCPADGLGYSNSKKSNTVNYFGNWEECPYGLKKSLAVEFDTFYNVERRDPKQGKQHWWINATEYISYNDNHLGVFMTTEPKYAHQPWGASQPMLKALHSDDENGAHFGSTPSVPTMADFQEHTVKIRYTRGFTTEKQGSGKITTTDIVTADGDRRRLKGNHLTRFKAELRTGYEFGYGNRVKANAKIKVNRDITCPTTHACRQSPPVATTGFGDDGEVCRVIKVIDDDEANLEDTETAGATAEEREVRITLMPAFEPKQDNEIDYNILKEFPGELQVFIDDMDRFVFQVAVEDRDMAKILDTDGNAYIGFTASTGSKGFAKQGFDPMEVHETHDILAWNFCGNPGCVPW